MAASIVFSHEDFDSPDATRLRAAQRTELDVRYGGDSEPGVKPTAADMTVFLVGRAGGRAVACGGLRRLSATTAEIKRMYVDPSCRGRGIGRLIVAELESEARRLGARRLVLETGAGQPEAMALYARCGYERIPCFGAYAKAPDSVCFARSLG